MTTLRTSIWVLASQAFLLLALLTPRVASAAIADCGNINVEADAQCKLQVSASCTAACTPPDLRVACSAEAYVGCQGTCNVDAEAQCTGSCDVGSCEIACEGQGPSFDCSADCTVNAEAMCDAKCSADGNQAECAASCKATAKGECDASCNVVRPEATCMAKCEASCQGECRARANVDCQVNCQTTGRASCEARLTSGKCEADCQKPEGALFCNGRYVDHGGNLDKCIAALNAALKVNVDTSARGSAQCSGNQCTAEGEAKAKASCALAQGPAAGVSSLGLLSLAFGFAMRRLRRRSRA